MARIDREKTGHVLRLTINRPDKKNALTNAMYGMLAEGFEEARHDAGVRCVLGDRRRRYVHRRQRHRRLRRRRARRPRATPTGTSTACCASSAPSRSPSSPPCPASRSASARRCCSIATWSSSPKAPCSRCLSSTSPWCRRPHPACCCRRASATSAASRCSRSARRSTRRPRWPGAFANKVLPASELLGRCDGGGGGDRPATARRGAGDQAADARRRGAGDADGGGRRRLRGATEKPGSARGVHRVRRAAEARLFAVLNASKSAFRP